MGPRSGVRWNAGLARRKVSDENEIRTSADDLDDVGRILFVRATPSGAWSCRDEARTRMVGSIHGRGGCDSFRRGPCVVVCCRSAQRSTCGLTADNGEDITMWPFNFKCEHPFSALQTQKEQTVTVIDEDFEQVDYHFKCVKCGEFIIKSHARTIGGVDAFMERGRQRMKAHNA